MAWNLSGYHEFIAAVNGIENPLAVEVQVDPALNKGADVLCVYTGTLIVGRLKDGHNVFEDFKGQSSADWSRGFVKFLVPTPGRRWLFFPIDGPPQGHQPKGDRITFFKSGTVVASLASIFNRHAANDAGWAVDGADLRALGNEDEGLQVEAKLAVRDSDGVLHRLAYQVTALGQQLPLPPVVHGDLPPLSADPRP